MSRKLFNILTILSIFRISASENLKTLLDIEKLLNSIHTQDTSEYRDLEFGHKLSYDRPNHHRHEYGNSHHKTNIPKLMNIQTMNLFMKPPKQTYSLDDILRTESDRMCKETGRCGCTGTRCGDMMNREDEVANEVDKIVDELNDQLERKEIITKENSDSDYDESVYDGSGDDDLSKRLRCNGDSCGDERYDFDYNIRPDYDLNNYVDVVILDNPKQNIKDEEYIDLTRNNLILDKDEANTKQKSYILEVINAKATDLQSYESEPTTDEFVNHYQTVRNDVIEQLRHYIQNNTPIPLKHLHNKQKILLRTLKMKYRQGLVKKDELPSEIVRIVFGEKSVTKIYPHIENNDNIYIPKWHYNSLLQFRRDLRSHKRILPLTTQQRERLLKKQKKPIQKLEWRKSLNQKMQRFGVPFNLEIQGLGQINP